MKLKKLLYLLQLEEYSEKRCLSWLKKYSINDLVEIKHHLKWTLRIKITHCLAYPFSFFLNPEKVVFLVNNFVSVIFKLLEKILVLVATIKLHYKPKLIKIVITGSYGKTTFKEELAHTLSAKYNIFKTHGNINTLTGVSLEIIKKLKERDNIAIIEAGAYGPGEINNIARLIKPDFGVITIIGYMHLERFGDVESIRKAKFELKRYFPDRNNFFAPSKNHEFIDFEQTITQIAVKLGLDLPTIRKQLKSFNPPEHRMEIKNITKDIVLIDDSYNSNPLGFKRALNLINKYPRYQKIVITPGMIELGKLQSKLNEQLALQMNNNIDLLGIVGKTNKKAFISGITSTRPQIVFLDKNADTISQITPLIKPPTVILLENDLPDHYF